MITSEDDAAVAEFIRTHGITRCPTACVLPTQAIIALHDRVALEQHAAEQDRMRQKIAAMQQFL